jgi:molecular chaperone HscB
MTLDLTQDYFSLFQLTPQYDVDLSELASQFRALQAIWHPDRFATADNEARRLSIQNTAFINEAYETLKKPRLRARYLLELNDVSFNDEMETSKDPMFLMQQMELRENIEEAEHADDPFEALDTVVAEVRSQAEQLEHEFKTAFAEENLQAAKDVVLKMRFFERIKGEVKQLEEKLEDQLI